jgi:phospholipase C
LPYQPVVVAATDQAAGSLKLTFGNDGPVGIAYHVRQSYHVTPGASGPWTFTIAPHHSAHHTWTPLATGATSVFDVTVYGPNGFYRGYKGSVAQNATNLIVDVVPVPDQNGLRLTIANPNEGTVKVQVADGYTGRTTLTELAPGETVSKSYDLSATHNWYDLMVTVLGDNLFHQHFAGHIENGCDSISDPGMGNRP